jgi:DNA-binding NtrC family response regulator
MQDVLRSIVRLAPLDSPVVIVGETGVGKERIAQGIHTLSPRQTEPFVTVDAGNSFDEQAIAIELFGDQNGIGALERAAGGTILLDDIERFPKSVQSSLVGVVERRRFRRVGTMQEIELRARILSATQCDLRLEVNRGSFREDLYYRLAAARIVVPPLRERPEDIDFLIRQFAREFTGQGDVSLGFDRIEALRRHTWPGNVRELKNWVEASLAEDRAKTLSGEVAKPARLVYELDPTAPIQPYREARGSALAAFERGYLTHLIAMSGSNASEAARRAKMDRSHLLSLLKRLGLR